MSMCFSTKVLPTAKTPLPSDTHEGNSKKIGQTRISNNEQTKSLETDQDSSSIYITESENSDDRPEKLPCPPVVSQIINSLSAVSTLGGLALIITGGMGMTLNKPIDNTAENIAMVLSGGALLVGSLTGNMIYANQGAASS